MSSESQEVENHQRLCDMEMMKCRREHNIYDRLHYVNTKSTLTLTLNLTTL